MRENPPLAALLLIALACTAGDQPSSSTADSAKGGTVVISVGGDPDGLFPPIHATATGKAVSDQTYDHLADLGPELNTVGDAGFTPRLAKSWRWSPDSLSIEFQLDQRARWHDGRPVRASDVVFTHALYKDPATASPTAPLIGSIDSVTASDSVTAVFWFGKRSPIQFYEATMLMAILPEHALEGIRGQALRTSEIARKPMGSGRFRFVSWTPGSSIEVTADTANYHGRPPIDRVIWSIAPDPKTVFTRLIGGEADVLEQVPMGDLPQLAAHRELRPVLLPGLDYNFVAFNLRDPRNRARPHPLFGDPALRRALTMAVDRGRTVRSVYDTLAAVALGPTVRAYPTTDTTLRQIPYLLDGARRLLDSLGWRVSGADSIRQRNGRRLEFTLTVPGVSRSRMNMAVILQDQLKQAGAKVNIDRLEIASFVDLENRRAFDAVFHGWHVEASPGGIRQTWGTSGAKPGGSNHGSYTNPAFDAATDSALSAMDLPTRRAHFKRAYQMIIDDAPAIWMAEPKTMMAMNRRIRTPALRPDAWWSSIGEWWIPSTERIARDRVGPPR
jgi:peptide/nickel transport system substrate-binding protein